MKRNYLLVGFALLLVTIVVVISTQGFLTTTSKNFKKVPGKGFAVVELFTSEGCSSCPGADAEVEKISGLHAADLYALCFHVDYWDRLGWKDEFSDAAYSKRQREYGDHFKLDGVYTPQVVVNGKAQFVGSDAGSLTRTVDGEIKNTDNIPIELSAFLTSGDTVNVTYKLRSPVNLAVNIALIQTAADTHVMRGENQGKTLHHINIVRGFRTFNQSDQVGSAAFALPKGIGAKECKAIVYLQDLKTRGITAAAATEIK